MMSCKLKYPGPVTGSLRITFHDTTTRPTLPLLYHILNQMSSIKRIAAETCEIFDIFIRHAELIGLTFKVGAADHGEII